MALLLQATCMLVLAGDDEPVQLNMRKAYPKALILAPVRELASQIFEEARKFAYQTGLRCVVCYGGAPAAFQVCSCLCGIADYAAHQALNTECGLPHFLGRTCCYEAHACLGSCCMLATFAYENSVHDGKPLTHLLSHTL